MNNNIPTRDSNMELYRIVAMFMVIFFHVFGEIDLLNNELFSNKFELKNYINLLFTSATFICVDMFVLLSGWYGINTKWNKIKAYIFQVLFYSVSIYVIMLLYCQPVQFSWKYLIHIFILDDYWFVPVYLMLYIFAPAINPFIRKSNNKEILTLLLSVITIQSIYGWINYRESGYMEGCSPISFLILYILGAYLQRMASYFNNISKKKIFICYISLILLNWIIAVVAKLLHNELLSNIAWQFSSPITIMAAACILLIFSKINIGYNKIINKIAASSFAAFLIHCFPLFYEQIFSETIIEIVSKYSYALALVILILLVFIFYAISILIDQIRIFIYNKINLSSISSHILSNYLK